MFDFSHGLNRPQPTITEGLGLSKYLKPTLQIHEMLKIFLFILFLEIDKDNQESGGVFMIFTFLLISVFTFFLPIP